MPRPPNNDPAVLLERANKERERWRRSQETYLERPENAKAHREVVNAYYQRNKERLKEAANKRNAEKRKAEEDTKKTAAERKREEEERKMMEANDVNAIVPAPKKKRGRKPKAVVAEVPQNTIVAQEPEVVPVAPAPKQKRKYVKSGKFKKVKD